MNKKSYIDRINNDASFREALIDNLCGYDKLDISHDLREFIENFITSELDKFREFENFYLYKGEDELILLLLPTIRKLYIKVYLSPPSIILNKLDKLELYKASFFIDHFSDYLVKMVKNNKKTLSKFESLDKTIELLNLIVENYISYLLDKCLKENDVKGELRELKIKKISI